MKLGSNSNNNARHQLQWQVAAVSRRRCRRRRWSNQRRLVRYRVRHILVGCDCVVAILVLACDANPLSGEFDDIEIRNSDRSLGCARKVDNDRSKHLVLVYRRFSLMDNYMP